MECRMKRSKRTIKTFINPNGKVNSKQPCNKINGVLLLEILQKVKYQSLKAKTEKLYYIRKRGIEKILI